MRWRTYRSYLEETYGQAVWRIGVDGGFSCPNRRSDGGGGCVYCDGTGSKAAYQRREESGMQPLFNEEVSEQVLLHQGSLSLRADSIKAQIARGKEFLVRRYKAGLFSVYFQAWTNTYAPLEDLKYLYDAALDALPESKELIVSTRPDEIDEAKADLLASYRQRTDRVWVELGLQSANDETLKKINRGHDAACYRRAADLLHKKGISVCTHVILGLPGESTADYIHTAKVVGEARSEAVKIHNLHIPGGTDLYDAFMDGEASAPCQRRHLQATLVFLRHIPKDMVVERLLAETPRHRLASPRDFGSKNEFIQKLEELMEGEGAWQGDLA